MSLKDYSTTASSNDGLGIADEGQAPNTVNDGIRTLMADVRAFRDTLEWRDWGHTVTRLSATQFYISGSDQTGVYTVGRRVKIVDGTSGTIYGTITVTDYNNTRAGDTTVTIAFDSTQMAGTLSSASVGLNPTKTPYLPPSLASYFDSSNQALGPNGFQNIPGGLVLKWGSGTGVSTGTTITFPTAFGTECVYVGISINYGGSFATSMPSSIGAASFVVNHDYAGTVSLKWFAVGY